MSENLASYYWRGHGPLWKVYWLYGVLGSTVLALILLFLMQRGPSTACGFRWCCCCLPPIPSGSWCRRCAFNVEKPVYGHMARALTAAWAINALLVLGFLELEFLQAAS